MRREGSLWQRRKPLQCGVLEVPIGDVLAGYLSRPPAIVVYRTQANDIHRNLTRSHRTIGGSSIPLLAAFPLRRDARGIADLDPHRTRPKGAVDLLGDNALGTKRA